MDTTDGIESGLKNITLDDGYQLIAAIDFGTTYSAYAFSFRCSPDDIYMNKNWGNAIGFESYKTPTSVLTKPGGEFDSFGFDAEEKFSRLEGNEGGPDGYNLYRNFKMVLHKKGAKMTSTITSTSGHVSLALDIFIMALTYLKNHMLQAIKKAQVNPLEMSQIRWVLTVPAIWSEESKRFMRTAAYWSDLIPEENSNHLVMVLEPEAASVHCRLLETDDFVERSVQTTKEELRFRSGQKILVIDAGGGTIDITAHEILMNGDVKELIHPYGGPFGGTTVDDEFITFLEKVLGADFIKDYKSKHPEDWIRFIISFEKRKKSVTPYEPASIRLPLSWLMAREYKSFSGKDIEQTFAESKVPGISLNFSDGTIVIDYDKVKEIFYGVIKNILTLVKKVLAKERKLWELSYIFLVGGFSECTFLQEECLKALNHYAPVLIPLSAQVAVLKGAVTFGHRPWQIHSRIAKCTYGCQQEVAYTEGVHDPSRMTEVNGVKKCVVFKPFVQKGDEIKVGKSITFKCKPAKRGDKKLDFRIFCTETTDVTYIDEEGVQNLGHIRLKNKKGPLSNDLEVRITFGFTELFIEALDKADAASTVKTSVDFLSKAMAPPRYHSSRKKSTRNSLDIDANTQM